MSFKPVALLAVVLNLLVAQAANLFISLDNTQENGRRFIDSDGRERFFHGFNVVYKGPPWHPSRDRFDPQYSMSKEDLANLQNWGFNFVRLGVMWPGVEPQKGVYNETYLAIMKQLVADLGSYGIYSLIDFHQDSLSELFCGEGIPTWAVETQGTKGFPLPLEKEPYPLNQSTGFPSEADCNKHQWAEYQFTYACGRAYQSLYSNYNDVQTRFQAYWAKLASVYSASPDVIGYEIMNEPWAGDALSDIELMVPGVADVKNLAPMYDNVQAAIRRIDTDHLIFFGSVTWDDFGVGFKTVPGGDSESSKSVLSYHFYIPPQIDMNETFAARMMDVKRLHCGAFLTEFDASTIDSGHTVLAKADSLLQSWAEWQFKAFVPITGTGYSFYDLPAGTVNQTRLSLFSRTYAHAVAGRTQTMNFNPITRVFTLVYTVKPSCTLPTDIYLNQALHYSSGFTVVASSVPNRPVKWSYSSPNHVLVRVDPSAQETDVITIVIAPQ